MDIEQLAGTKLGNYEIESLLGQGGMGVVYKARQISLNRSVALKFLPPELIDSREWKERFHREAQAAAALAHPNICTIHEINELDDKVFIAMEYLEGQTLDKKIKAGPLSIDEAIDIGLRAAEGLKHAHKRGIVHRDIKPANIMMTEDGQTKIMDFGLAKLSGKTRLTKTATVMGTIAYMSPEQARGDKDIGNQTDIWSLGVVLYELLTGLLPFDADTDTGLIYRIVNEDPEPARNHRSDIPGSLVSIIEKAIQKNPGSRYEDAEELIADLESVRSGAPASAGSSSASIAVLPFADMSPQKDQEYFCDGLAEELINALTQLRDLRVIARTSAFSFKGKDVKVGDIGRELKVETVLEGSVRKAGNRLRITAQLIDVTGGHHLWSERYDRELEDVFAIQDEITLAIVEKLRPRLLGEHEERLAKRQTVGLNAYNLYLKGLWFMNKMTEEGNRKAIEYFKEALGFSPAYALAYIGMANSYIGLPFFSSVSPAEIYPKARELVLQGLEIDKTVAEAYASLGSIMTSYDWDWEGAEKEYKAAIELNPGYANGHALYSRHLMWIGRFEEGIQEIEHAQSLDPLSLFINMWVGVSYEMIEEHDKAIESARKMIELDPNASYAHLVIGWAYLSKSMYDEATEEFEKEREILKGFIPVIECWIGSAYALMNKKGETQKALDNLLTRSKEMYVAPSLMARLYVALGEQDEGIDWFNKAYEERDSFMCSLKTDGIVAAFGLNSDPRFQAILKKMNLEP